MKTLISSRIKLWLPIIFGAGMALIVQTAHAGGMGAMEEGEPIKKSPSFEEVDKNGDHYVTKDELKDDPFLLKHFDTVDAGKDGKLEEHEYENLIMEKRRERGM